MKPFRFPLVAAFAATIVALMSFFHAGTASAQCSPVTVTNNTGVQLKLKMYDNTSGDSATIAAPPGVSMWGTILPSLTGVVSAAGTRYPFAPCTPCITIPASFPAPAQCATVCYNPMTCQIGIIPCAAPCLP